MDADKAKSQPQPQTSHLSPPEIFAEERKYGTSIAALEAQMAGMGPAAILDQVAALLKLAQESYANGDKEWADRTVNASCYALAVAKGRINETTDTLRTLTHWARNQFQDDAKASAIYPIVRALAILARNK